MERLCKTGDWAAVRNAIDQNPKQNLEQGPLHFAARYNAPEDIVNSLILRKGFDANAPFAGHGSRPLHFAASNGHVEVAQLLIERGAHIHAKTNDGWTPLHNAAKKGHVKVSQLLMDRGADIHAKDKLGSTPLHIATSNGHLKVAQLLIERGADIHAKDKLGSKPLHLATSNGHVEVAQLLIERGAHIHAKDCFGRTPLHNAAKKGHVKVAQLLMDHGANSTRTDWKGRTSLDIAKEFKRDAVVHFLTSYNPVRPPMKTAHPPGNNGPEAQSTKGPEEHGERFPLTSFTFGPLIPPPSLQRASEELRAGLEFRRSIQDLQKIHADLETARVSLPTSIGKVLHPLTEHDSLNVIKKSFEELFEAEAEQGTSPLVSLEEITAKQALFDRRDQARRTFVAESQRVVSVRNQLSELESKLASPEAAELISTEGSLRKSLAREVTQSSGTFASFEEGEVVLNKIVKELHGAMFSGDETKATELLNRMESAMLALTTDVLFTPQSLEQASTLIASVESILAQANKPKECANALEGVLNVAELQQQEWLLARSNECSSLVDEAKALKIKFTETCIALRRSVEKRDHDDDVDDYESLETLIQTLETERLGQFRQRDALSESLRNLSLCIPSSSSKRAESSDPINGATTPVLAVTETSSSLKRTISSARTNTKRKKLDVHSTTTASVVTSLGAEVDQKDDEDEIKCDFPEMFDRIMLEWNARPQRGRHSASTPSDDIFNKACQALAKANQLLPQVDDGDFENITRTLPVFRPSLNMLKVVRIKTTGAMKVLKRIPVQEMNDIRRLRRSLVLSRKVAHPCILACDGAIVEVSRQEKLLYLQLPYLEGGDLLNWVQSRPRSLERKRDVIAKVSDAIVALHREGIYHRDVKPQNILMTSMNDDAVPKLTDFEFSKDLGNLTHATMAGGGGRVGTLGYMAAEVLSMTALQSLDPRFLEPAEVFALAATYVIVVLYDGMESTVPRGRSAWFNARSGLTSKGAKDPYQAVLLQALDDNASKRPSMKTLRNLICKRVCCMKIECDGDGSCNLLKGIACPQGKHFICAKDVDAYVSGICDSKDIETTKGEVLCALGTSCGDGVVPLDVLQRHLSPDTMKKFIDARVRVMETVVTAMKDKEKEEEVKRVLALSVLEQKVLQTRVHIVEEIMTSKCPSCRNAWLDFDGCAAVACKAPCKANFCGLCSAGPFQNAHPHVRECRWNTLKRGEYHCSDVELQVMWNNRRRSLVTEFFGQGELQTNRELRVRVLNDATISGILTELGLVIR